MRAQLRRADCFGCGWHSLLVPAGEALDLAGCHDDLHHRGRPTALVHYALDEEFA